MKSRAHHESKYRPGVPVMFDSRSVPFVGACRPGRRCRPVRAEIHPVGIDVKLHRPNGAGPHEQVGQVDDIEARATHVHDGPVGRDSEPRAPDVDRVSERVTPTEWCRKASSPDTGCPLSTSRSRFWRTATTFGAMVTSRPHAPTVEVPSL